MKKYLIGASGGVILLLCIRAATMAIAPLNIAFMRFLGVSDLMAPTVSGTILFTGYIFAVVGPMVGGWFADKVGNRLAIVLGGVVFTAAYFLWAYSTGYGMLYFYRAFLALGAGVISVSMMSFLHTTAPAGKKGAGMGLYGIGWGLGSALGPIVAANLVPTGIREPFMFLSVACLIAVAVTIILMTISQKLFGNTEEQAAEGDESEKRKISLKSLKEFSPALKYYFVLSFCFIFGQLAILTTVDDFGVQVLGLEVGKGLMALVAFSIVSLLQPLGGMVGDKMGKPRAILIGIAVVTVCFIGVAANTVSFPLQIVLMGIAGFGSILYMPNTLAIVGDMAPKALKGTALGMYQASAAVGSALGALLSGLIYTATNVKVVFWLAPLAMAVGLIFTFMAFKYLQKNPVTES